MHDRLFESDTFGRPLDLDRHRRPVVWAPHPDDEVFGCGGLLALWSDRGTRAHVVVLSDGSAQPGSTPAGSPSPIPGRMAESRQAAEVLGHTLEVWALPDRSLRCDEGLIERMVALLTAHDADVVLAPALHEPHPDHQACTLALVCALARMRRRPDVLLYESGGALTTVTTLVDIGRVLARKEQAMRCFASQEAAQPYVSRITARDHFRAMTLGPGAQAAEAYALLPTATKGWPAVVQALDPLFHRGRGQAAAESDLPLVSVLVRTVGDAHLERTLASVRAQTYARLEVVVVAAHGATEVPQAVAALESTGLPVRWVAPGRRLNRPAAANAALDAAGGGLLLFLDDDDLICPDHVQRLVSALAASGSAWAAHSDVQVVDAAGGERTRYEGPCLPMRMAFTNMLPIHAVLFDARLVRERGCRFDEDLPVLEDWDFWLQVMEHTELAHAPGVSAIYRWQDRSALHDAGHVHHHARWRDVVQARWLGRWPQDKVLAAIRWYAVALDEAQQGATAAVALHARADEAEQRLQAAQGDVVACRAELVGQLGRLEAQQRELASAIQRAADSDALLRDTRTELALAGQRLEQAVREGTAAQEQLLGAQHAREQLAVRLGLAEGALAQYRVDAGRELELAQARMETLGADLAQSQAQAVSLAEQVRQWQALHAAKDAELARASARMEALTAEAARTRADAESLQAQLNRWQALHAAKDAELTQVQALRAGLAAELAEAHAGRAVLSDRLVENEEAARRHEARWQALLDEQRGIVQTLMASTSWRVTQPLRWLGALLKGRG